MIQQCCSHHAVTMRAPCVRHASCVPSLNVLTKGLYIGACTALPILLHVCLTSNPMLFFLGGVRTRVRAFTHKG